MNRCPQSVNTNMAFVLVFFHDLCTVSEKLRLQDSSIPSLALHYGQEFVNRLFSTNHELLDSAHIVLHTLFDSILKNTVSYAKCT